MDRLERLLDLVHVLQASAEPIPLTQLRGQFSDYAQGNPESIRRKFERDKKTLAGLGIVLRYVEGGAESTEGYVVDTEATYLPEVPLSSADVALLGAAARAGLEDPSFPHKEALRLALAKLGASDLPTPRVLVHHGAPRDEGSKRAHLEKLASALARHKRVHMSYEKPGGATTERDVDLYGVFMRRGVWYASGHDHHRGELRLFRVSRITSLKINAAKPEKPDYEIPPDYDLERETAIDPLHFAVHAPTKVRIRVDDDIAFLAERFWGARDADGVVEIETTHMSHLVEEVLRLGKRAELLTPPEARSMVRDALLRVLSLHEGEAS